jgi:hypothetical protein
VRWDLSNGTMMAACEQGGAAAAMASPFTRLGLSGEERGENGGVSEEGQLQRVVAPM